VDTRNYLKNRSKSGHLKPVEINSRPITRPGEDFLRLERVQDVLVLHITPESCISFRDEWVEQLRALPYSEFGEFIRSTIYPALSAKEQKLWNKRQ